MTKPGDAADLIIQGVAVIPRENNQNGKVDAADYTVWRNLFGQSGANLAADDTGPADA